MHSTAVPGAAKGNGNECDGCTNHERLLPKTLWNSKGNIEHVPPQEKGFPLCQHNQSATGMRQRSFLGSHTNNSFHAKLWVIWTCGSSLPHMRVCILLEWNWQRVQIEITRFPIHTCEHQRLQPLSINELHKFQMAHVCSRLEEEMEDKDCERKEKGVWEGVQSATERSITETRKINQKANKTTSTRKPRLDTSAQ